MKTVVFWDIDGTLLTTGRAGVFALEDAASDVVGRPVQLQSMPTAGLTDREIAIAILQNHQVEPHPDKVDRLLELYADYLPASLYRKQGAVLQGVRELLEHLHSREDVLSLLLTGNIRAGAAAKLTHYGLNHFFQDGAFSDRRADRSAIAREGLALAQRLLGAISPDQIYVVGDTPHDIRCGKAIGAKVVAVASGSYSLADLEEHAPWWAIPTLPEPAIFIQKIGLTDQVRNWPLT